MLTGLYYKKIYNAMKEEGEFPDTQTGAVEFYEWSSNRRTLYYLPIEGPIDKYSFSQFAKPPNKSA